MELNLTVGLSTFATVLGVVSLLSSSRVGVLRSQIDELKEKLKALNDRLAIVENERDSHKRDADGLRERVIALLTENRTLREQVERLKNVLKQ